MAARAKVAALVAEICLYGTRVHGAGWIASIKDGTPSGKMLGNGELKPHLSMTEAIWVAANALREAGALRGTVRIFEPSGQFCADAELSQLIPSFGDLKWTRAPVYVVSVEELLKHAEAQP